MQLIDGLRDSLKDHLGWGKPRLYCLIGMLLALLRIQRMDLSRLALVMESDADVSSRYRRLQRFFHYCPVKHRASQLVDTTIFYQA